MLPAGKRCVSRIPDCVAKKAADFDVQPGGELFPATEGETRVHDFPTLIATHRHAWSAHTGKGWPEPTSLPRAAATTAVSVDVAIEAYPGHSARAVRVAVSTAGCITSQVEMSNVAIPSADAADQLLNALGDQLASMGSVYELIVVGGSALLVLGLVNRPTKDVDVVALKQGETVRSAKPLPEDLMTARDRVARDLRLPVSWLNDGPADLIRFGLPEGFLDRAERREYGPALTVLFASRFDQVHFKLYATVDQGPGKHEADLRALEPNERELIAAARWSTTHDPSEGYRGQLLQGLEVFGVAPAELEL